MENIPQEVMDKIRERIEERDDEYADNFRVAKVTDSQLEYERIKDHGCCGSHDETVTINGVEWNIGWNFGH